MVPVSLWWASTSGVSTEQRIADAEPPPPPRVTVQLEMRELSDTLVFRGLVTPADTVEVLPPDLTDRKAVVVDIPVSVGQTVESGDILAVVSDRPLIAIPMAAPLYRSLLPGMTGEDVARLQAGLNEMGYDVRVDGRFGPETQDATKQLYEDRGFEILHASDLRTSEEGSATLRGVVVPLGELVGLRDLPAVIASIEVGVGDLADDVLLTLTTSEVVVEARVDSTLAALLTPGLRAVAGPSLQYSLEVEANDATDDQGRAVIFLRPMEPIPPDMIGSDILIEALLAVSDGEVLAVPVSAIRSNSDGQYLRVLVSGPAPQEVGVEVGLSIGGWVEIVDAEIPLQPGTEVIVG